MKLWMKAFYGQNAFMKQCRGDEHLAIYPKDWLHPLRNGFQTNKLFFGKADVVGNMLAVNSVTMAVNNHLTLE